MPPLDHPITDFQGATFAARELERRIKLIEHQLDTGKFVSTEPFRIEINAMHEDIKEIDSLVKAMIKLVVGQLITFVSGLAVGIVMWIVNSGGTP